MKKHKKTRQVLAWIGIILLLSMYLMNLVLALIGSEMATAMLRVSAASTVAIPLVLYAFVIALRMGKGENDLPENDEED